jgi:hypothetical protein
MVPWSFGRAHQRSDTSDQSEETAIQQSLKKHPATAVKLRSVYPSVIPPMLVALLAAASLGGAAYGDRAPRRAKLEDIKVLTFRRGRMSTARRASPVPALKCVGGSAMADVELHPEVVQCRNVGWDGVDVSWECSADLDDVRAHRRALPHSESFSGVACAPYIRASVQAASAIEAIVGACCSLRAVYGRLCRQHRLLKP